MKTLKKLFALGILIVVMSSCASGYRNIQPEQINYNSSSADNAVLLNYKFNLLDKKYRKKEIKRGIKLVAVKITNNTDKDLIFGKDVLLQNDNGNLLNIVENDYTFKKLKQSVPSYLWYLLLSPLNLQTTETDRRGVTSSNNIFPAGLILGPGISGGNMIAAGSANKKFKTDLLTYDIQGTTLKKGTTTYGLIGIKTEGFVALKIKYQGYKLLTSD